MNVISPAPIRATRRGICLTPMETRRDIIVEMALLADKLGYEIFSVPEGWGFDSTLILTEIALRTDRIRPMAGILSIWSRTPGAIAMNAATLADISDDRYILGLGASTRALAEGFHGKAFGRSAERLAATTTEVRRLLQGERAQTADGVESRPLRLGQKPRPDLPIYIAAMGPGAIKVTAEQADGWFPYYVTRDRFADWTPEVRALRHAAGAAGRPLTVAAGPTVAVGADQAAARQVVATNVAWYMTAMGDVYANAVSADGYGDAVVAIKAANPKPSPKFCDVPMEAEILLDQLTAYGEPDRVEAALQIWDDAVDVTMVSLAPGMPWPDIEASLIAAAPKN